MTRSYGASRSHPGHSELLEDARRHGFDVVALDLGLDLPTPTGKLVANVLLLLRSRSGGRSDVAQEPLERATQSRKEAEA